MSAINAVAGRTAEGAFPKAATPVNQKQTNKQNKTDSF
jgi:hypothetical protein